MLRLALRLLAPACLVLALAPLAMVAPVEAATPTIAITNPAGGATIHGSTVTVSVQVSNFKLVKPILHNPPKLPGNQGHIHYYVDNISNFNPLIDASAATSHTFTNLTPGSHTLFAYLATSQHQQFPGTKMARVSVTIAPATAQAGVAGIPATGGAAHNGGSSLNLPALLLGTFLFGLGLTLVGRRFAFQRGTKE